MAGSIADVSTPSRVADPNEGISAEELGLAARNHGMPLEVLRYDLTPLGLHYLLIHYDIPAVDAAAWRLTVGGMVDRPGALDLEQLKARPRTTIRVTLECAGNGRARLLPRPVSQPWLVEAVGTAEWTGTPLAPLLAESGIAAGAVDVVFTGADHGVERGVEQDYQRSLSIADALREEVLVCYEMNGQPLLPQHGYPVRLIVPGWYGMAHVKWLTDITVIDQPFSGYQQMAYRLRQEPTESGVPLTRIQPRALLIPPGMPDFMSRRRVVRPGSVTIEGRAWSGGEPIASVEVSIDGGGTWAAAELDSDDQHRWAWRGWRYDWTATPGRYSLSARATDAAGRAQPETPDWNRGGFANNLVQLVDVLCLDSSRRTSEQPFVVGDVRSDV